MPSVPPSASTLANPACGPLVAKDFELPPFDKTVAAEVANPKVVDRQNAMAPFYEALGALVRGQAKRHVRIAVYGDSNMTMDYITGGLRRFLQARFGDGGHGFVAAARPWNWYRHMDVRHEVSESAWTHYATSTHPTMDHHYGMSNICAESLSLGAWSYVETAKDDAPIGTKVSSVDVYYMKRPKVGMFEIRVDGKVAKEVDTRDEETRAAFEHLDLDDGPHKVEVKVSKGFVRMLGTTFERTKPSVVVDSFGTGSFNYDQFNRVSAASRDPMLQRRQYDLVVFLLGTNVFTTDEKTEADMAAVAEWYRTALPKVPLLYMTPPDIIEARPPTHSAKRIAKLADLIVRVADKLGAASWDFRAGMGGDMAAAAFAKAGYAEFDYTHLKEGGGALMGQRFAHALFEGLKAYADRSPAVGCSDTRTASSAPGTPPSSAPASTALPTPR
jgi:lysophospholipase L1-like esterase